MPSSFVPFFPQLLSLLHSLQSLLRPLPLLPVLLSLSTPSLSSSPSFPCPCIIFNSSGVFHSPNFPRPLPPTDCILYHFIAPPSHRVLLSFDILSLPPSQDCSSSIRVYHDTQDGQVDLLSSPQILVCSNDPYSPPPSLLSSSFRHLVLHISTTSVSRGFSGQYSFFPKTRYQSSSSQVGDCSFVVTPPRGTIYSPSYPTLIPPSLNCSYRFPSVNGFLLTLRSSSIQLPKGTTLEIFDDTGETVKEMDTSTHSMSLTTTSPLVMILQSALREQKGLFRIDFEYAERRRVEQVALKSILIDGCVHEISSSKGKSGRFSTSELTSSIQGGQPQRCLISLNGEGKEKVSITFTRFNLYQQMDGKKSCEEEDHVVAYVLLNSQLSSIVKDGWCANDMPPPLISPSGVIHINYVTKSNRALRDSVKEEYGFEFEYLFHDDWNMDKMAAQWDTRRNCRFVFNSALNVSGELWSLNYPGLYPRSTLCEYIFIGNTHDEVVHIDFDYFDVEGFDQCGIGSESDYVLFSNYQTHDRTNRKFCGRTLPRSPIVSESNYFRLIFSSNELFDGTGFHARYQFLTPVGTSLSRVKHVSSLSNACFNCASLIILFLFFSLLSL